MVFYFCNINKYITDIVGKREYSMLTSITIEMRLETEKFLAFKEFYDIENTVTDRYKFMKIFMRKYYEQYVKLPKSRIDEIKDQVEYQTNSTASLQSLPDEFGLNAVPNSNGRFKIFNKIRDRFFKRNNKDKIEVIEIFDVIIYSSMRLEILNTDKQSYLLNVSNHLQENYEDKIPILLSEDEHRPKGINQPDPIQIIRDPRVVDVRLEDYQQIHFLRFERGNSVRIFHFLF